MHTNSSMIASDGLLPQNLSHEGIGGPFLPGSQSFEAYNTNNEFEQKKSPDSRRKTFANRGGTLDTSGSHKASSFLA